MIASLAALLITVTAVTSLAASNSLWSRTYGGHDRDSIAAIEGLPDGGLVTVGSTMSFGGGNSDLWLMRLDAEGQIIWQKTYGGTKRDVGLSICATPDDGFVLLGATYSFSSDNAKTWILKLNSRGEIQWQQILGGENNDYAHSIHILPTGYILMGITNSDDYFRYKAFVVRLNSQGSVLWQKLYDGGVNYYATALFPTRDSGYIVIGSNFSLLKLNSSGNKQWVRSFGGKRFDNATSAVSTQDGGYLVAGLSSSFTHPNVQPKLMLIKFDQRWKVQWQKIYEHLGGGLNFNTQLRRIANGYVIAARIRNPAPAFEDVWVARLDFEGNLIWQKSFGTDGRNQASNLHATANGDIFLAATAPVRNGDAWLIRLDIAGRPVANCNIQIKTTKGFPKAIALQDQMRTRIVSPAHLQTTRTNVTAKDSFAISENFCISD
jgi:hypothetical protein